MYRFVQLDIQILYGLLLTNVIYFFDIILLLTSEETEENIWRMAYIGCVGHGGSM